MGLRVGDEHFGQRTKTAPHSVRGRGVEGTSSLWKLMGTMAARLRQRGFKGNCQDEDQQCLSPGLQDPAPSGSCLLLKDLGSHKGL